MSTEQATDHSQQAYEPTPQSGGSWVRLPDGTLVPAQPASQEQDQPDPLVSEPAKPRKK